MNDNWLDRLAIAWIWFVVSALACFVIWCIVALTIMAGFLPVLACFAAVGAIFLTGWACARVL